jgi:hypothetical protein
VSLKTRYRGGNVKGKKAKKKKEMMHKGESAREQYNALKDMKKKK